MSDPKSPFTVEEARALLEQGVELQKKLLPRLNRMRGSVDPEARLRRAEELLRSCDVRPCLFCLARCEGDEHEDCCKLGDFLRGAP